MKRLLPVWFAFACAAAAFAQSSPPSAALVEARKKAVEELAAVRAEMARLGYKAEADDCVSIQKKVLDPDKPMPEKGGSTPYPGDEAFAALLQTWSDLGDRLAAIYREAEGKVSEKEKEQVELLAGWFESFKEVARGTAHLNRRRKFIKITPVLCDWSGSIGGYLHGRYLVLNRNHPSTAGLGAHNEEAKLPGYTPEGAEAAHGILGGGSAESVMDGWLGSEFHRDPVFSHHCTRIHFGGYPGSMWSCRNAGGGSGRALATVLTWPGDGDTGIPTWFANEGPNPLEKYGITSAGTFVVIDFLKNKPRKPKVRLLDAEGAEVEILDVGKNPLTFVAKNPLQANVTYTVEVSGQDGGGHKFSFTTGGGGWGGR